MKNSNEILVVVVRYFSYFVFEAKFCFNPNVHLNVALKPVSFFWFDVDINEIKRVPFISPNSTLSKH